MSSESDFNSYKLTVQDKISVVEKSGGKSLSLLGLSIFEIPPEVWNLENLESLNLGSNSIKTIPREISKLKQLRRLWLFDNQLESIPSSIWDLIKLEFLYINDNKITKLPEIKTILSQLKFIDAGNNKLSGLPSSIYRITNLTMLDLRNNNIIDLPSNIGKLESLDNLNIVDNAELSIPPEILKHSPGEILDFYFKSKKKSKRLNESKVLFLGQGSVGKTSLVNRLIKNLFDENEEKTDGINICEWNIEDKNNEKIKLNIWDFGGQEIMHSTHQFFLTKRSLYILVLNARAGENQSDLYYWLEMIRVYGGGSPLLIVVNKCDQHYEKLDENRLLIDYEDNLNIQGFHYVSCKDGDGIKYLKEKISKLSYSLPHVSDLLPENYFEVKNSLERSSRNKDFITDKEYLELCKEKGVLGDGRYALLRFLHDLGCILHYDDPDQVYQIQDTKVLNPEWVTGGVYRFLNDPDLLRSGTGILEPNDFKRILSCDAELMRRYPKNRYRFLVDMMRKYEIGFDFPFDPKKILIPSLLSKNEPDVGWIKNNKRGRNILNFEFWYSVLPLGLIPRFILRMHHHLTDSPTYWRSGVVLKIENCRALIRGDNQKERVYIQVQGSNSLNRRTTLSIIRNCFNGIHQTYGNLKVDSKVPLPDELYAPPVDYEFLLKLDRSGVTEQWFEKAEKMYEVRQLLNGVDGDGYDLFLSHNSKDKSLALQLSEILSKHEIACWLDNVNLTPGQPWQREIVESMRSCSYIGVLIGPNAFGVWHSKECQLSLSQAELLGIPIIPIILPGTKIEERILPPEFEFLKLLTWVDFGRGFCEKELEKLVCAIKSIC